MQEEVKGMVFPSYCTNDTSSFYQRLTSAGLLCRLDLKWWLQAIVCMALGTGFSHSQGVTHCCQHQFRHPPAWMFCDALVAVGGLLLQMQYLQLFLLLEHGSSQGFRTQELWVAV